MATPLEKWEEGDSRADAEALLREALEELEHGNYAKARERAEVAVAILLDLPDQSR